MDFRLELSVKPLPQRINIRHKVALVGSCFTDHMGSRLRSMKIPVLENPNGILFNPVSIQQAIQSWIEKRTYTAVDLFFANDCWTSWDFHGQFSHPNQEQCLQGINASIAQAHQFLQEADWLILTLGSAFLYELNSDALAGTVGQVAANCHKVPANHFVHRLASLQEINTALEKLITQVRIVNPDVRIIFTVSPVRHYREGLIENNRSKGTLHLAVAQMQQQFDNVFYFPAYELIIDDLRDYRFYAEDMVHPNYAATRYVWEKFSAATFDEETLSLMQPLEQLRTAMQHRPIHPDTAAHQQFLKSMLVKTQQLSARYPFLDLSEELQYFAGKNA